MPLKSYFKIILIGDAGVGKTQLWHAFNNIFKNENEKTAFNEEYHQTLGSDFDPHEHILQNGKSERSAYFNLWDGPGDKRFQSLAPVIFKNSDAFILNYDVTNPASLEAIEEWMEVNVEMIFDSNKSNKPIFFLLGNKNDLESEVSDQYLYDHLISKLIDQYDIEIITLGHCSAKNGSNIEDLSCWISAITFAKHNYDSIDEYQDSIYLRRIFLQYNLDPDDGIDFLVNLMKTESSNNDHQDVSEHSKINTLYLQIGIGVLFASSIAIATAILWPSIIALPLIAAGAAAISAATGITFGAGLYAGLGIGLVGSLASVGLSAVIRRPCELILSKFSGAEHDNVAHEEKITGSTALVSASLSSSEESDTLSSTSEESEYDLSYSESTSVDENCIVTDALVQSEAENLKEEANDAEERSHERKCAIM